VLNDGQVAPLVCGTQRAIAQQFGVTENGRHWRADFMADIGQKLAFGLAGILCLHPGLRELGLGMVNTVHHGIEVFRQGTDLIAAQHRYTLVQRPTTGNRSHGVMHQPQTPKQHGLNTAIDDEHGY